jgi:hypothetical protein
MNPCKVVFSAITNRFCVRASRTVVAMADQTMLEILQLKRDSLPLLIYTTIYPQV